MKDEAEGMRQVQAGRQAREGRQLPLSLLLLFLGR